MTLDELRDKGYSFHERFGRDFEVLIYKDTNRNFIRRVQIGLCWADDRSAAFEKARERATVDFVARRLES